jgi:hypothetical protein
LRTATALFEQAADVVPIPTPPHPIVVAEYGAGDGHNGLAPIATGVAALRRRTRPEHAIAVIHTDTADNDFTALFHTLQHHSDSYLRTDRATFCSAVGRSFLTQVLPAESVHLGWSSWAIHWLSQVPAPILDHLQVSFSADPSVRAAYARQAAHDWHEFIAFRGRELCPGGRLVILAMGQHENDTFGLGPLLDALTAILSDLRTQGLISDEERRAMSIPVVGRCERDFLSPFAPSGRFERLRIIHLEVTDAPDRFWAQYQIDGDAEAFATNWTAFAQAAVFGTFGAALASPEQRAHILQRVQTMLIERLAAAPEPMPIPMAYLVVEKQPR